MISRNPARTSKLLLKSVSLRTADRKARQRESESRTLSGLTAHAYLAPGGLHQLPRDPQPHSEPAVVARIDGPLESLEDPFLVGFSDSDAMVFDGKPGLRLVCADLDVNRVVTPELQRVLQQVANHFFDVLWAPEALNRPRCLQRDLAAGLLSGLRHARNHRRHECRQVHVLRIEL